MKSVVLLDSIISKVFCNINDSTIPLSPDADIPSQKATRSVRQDLPLV